MILVPYDMSNGASFLLMCWFLDAGDKEPPQAHLTGDQKASRHEVAGSWAPAEQRSSSAPSYSTGAILRPAATRAPCSA